MTRFVAVAAGVALGMAYTLSPLTVLSVAALAALGYAIARQLTPRERCLLYTSDAAAICSV